MENLLIEIAKTDLPTILVMSGIMFLFVAIVGKIGASIVVDPKKQKIAGLLGSFLLIGGVILYFLRPSPTTLTYGPTRTITSPPSTTTQRLEPTPPTKKLQKSVPSDIADIAMKTRGNWLFGNYNDALDGFAVVAAKGKYPKVRKLAEKRLNWLQPYRGRIIFADDFEVDTLKEGIWGTHPGYPQEEGSFFKRVQINSNYVFEGYGHHHAVAKRILAYLEKGDVASDFEIQVEFYPVNPSESGAHINTTLDPNQGRFTIGLYMGERKLGLFEERHGQSIARERTQVFESRWYHLRATVQDRHVQVFIDDRLMLDYESPSSQRLLGNFNLETLTGKVRFDDLLVITR
jgi:hypothetical protein